MLENVNHEVIIKKSDRGRAKMEIIPKQNNSANLINKVVNYSSIDLNVSLLVMFYANNLKHRTLLEE